MAEPPFPISAALGDSGHRPEFVVGGKTYRMGHPTQAAKDRFCKGIVQAELRKYAALVAEGVWTPARSDERVEELGGQIDRGEHQPGGPLFDRYSLGTERATGVMIFLWSLLAEDNPGITVEQVRALQVDGAAAVRLAVRQVVPRFFEWGLAARKIPPERLAEAMAAIRDEIDRLLPATPTADRPPESTSSSPGNPTTGSPPASPD